MEMGKIWWNQVPNARNFVEAVISNKERGESAVVVSSHQLPWRDCFHSLVDEAGTCQQVGENEKPDEYLLNKCKPETRNLYRTTESVANFLAKRDDIPIHGSFFWVTLTDTALLNSWMDFVAEYLEKRDEPKSRALFVIECKTDVVPTAKKGVDVFSFDEYIGEYDRSTFGMLAASSVKEPTIVKKYLSEMLSSIIENDVELCEKIIQHYVEFLEKPYETTRKIVEDEGLLSLFTKTEEEVLGNIWKAQLRVVFPILEEFRKDFIKKYRSEIEKALCCEAIMEAGKRVTDPADVELGALSHMLNIECIHVVEKDKEPLRLHWRVRNQLAHLQVVDFADVRSIIC